MVYRAIALAAPLIRPADHSGGFYAMCTSVASWDKAGLLLEGFGNCHTAVLQIYIYGRNGTYWYCQYADLIERCIH